MFLLPPSRKKDNVIKTQACFKPIYFLIFFYLIFFANIAFAFQAVVTAPTVNVCKGSTITVPHIYIKETKPKDFKGGAGTLTLNLIGTGFSLSGTPILKYNGDLLEVETKISDTRDILELKFKPDFDNNTTLDILTIEGFSITAGKNANASLLLASNSGNPGWIKSNTVFVTVIAGNIPVPDIMESKETPCINEVVTYSVPKADNITYEWRVPADGEIITGSNNNEIQVQWKTSGTKNISVKANTSVGGCESAEEETKEITVVTKPAQLGFHIEQEGIITGLSHHFIFSCILHVVYKSAGYKFCI